MTRPSQDSSSAAFAVSCPRRPLDTGLNFSRRDSGQEQLVGGNRFDPIQHRLCGLGRRSSETTLVSKRYTGLLEIQWWAMAAARPQRCERLRPGFRCEQPLLQIWLRQRPQLPPLIDRQKHRRLHASLRHDLRPFPDARLKKLAKFGPSPPEPATPCACVPPALSSLTIYMTI